MPTQEDPFIAHLSKWRLVLLLIAAIGFVVAGLLMAGVFGDPPISKRMPAELSMAVGWLCVLFFGIGAVVIGKRLFDEGEELRIDAQGIWWRRLPSSPIRWDEIYDVTLWQFRGQTSIILHLHNPDRHRQGRLAEGLANMNRSLTGGDLALSLTGTDRNVEEAMEAISRFSGKY